MDKIEFSDVYKFIASIGLFLIGLSVIIPWFVNRDASFLLIESEKLSKLTPTAQSIIKNQQSTLCIFNSWIKVLSPVILIAGISITSWALIYWRKRQLVSDSIQDEELKSKQMQNMSDIEKRDVVKEAITNEIIANSNGLGAINEDDNVEETNIAIPTTIDDKINFYLDIENKVFNGLARSSSDKFEAIQNVKIVDTYFDIILRSKSISVMKDRVIEIKYFESHLNIKILEGIVSSLLDSSKIYTKNVKRQCYPVLVIIYGQNELKDLIVQYKKQLQSYATKIGMTVKVNFYHKNEIDRNNINYLIDSPKSQLSI